MRLSGKKRILVGVLLLGVAFTIFWLSGELPDFHANPEARHLDANIMQKHPGLEAPKPGLAPEAKANSGADSSVAKVTPEVSAAMPEEEELTQLKLQDSSAYFHALQRARGTAATDQALTEEERQAQALNRVRSRLQQQLEKK